MPWFIELSLSNGGTLHLDADPNDPVADLERQAKRATSKWVKSVEGAWVNPEQIVSAVVVELQAAPTSRYPQHPQTQVPERGPVSSPRSRRSVTP